MDPNSSYRLAVRVGAYVKINDDGSREYCEALNIAKILDRDISNWDDMLNELATDINLGCNHKLRVTYWDKMSRNYEEIASDQKLLHAKRMILNLCMMLGGRRACLVFYREELMPQPNKLVPSLHLKLHHLFPSCKIRIVVQCLGWMMI